MKLWFFGCCRFSTLVFIFTLLPCKYVSAGCCAHVTPQTEDAQSDIILEARVTGHSVHYDDRGSIVTDVTLEIIEVFKGEIMDETAPINIRIPGGRMGKLVEWNSAYVSLKEGHDYIFRLKLFRGQWTCVNARASEVSSQSEVRRKAYRKMRFAQSKRRHNKRHVPKFPRASELNQAQRVSSETTKTSSSDLLLVDDSTATPSASAPVGFGYLVGSDGMPARFTVCDDGSPIEYIVDTEVLPPGITVAQALQATKDAFAAWSEVSGLRFKYVGQEVFGQSAASINISDNKIRIQLHNKYNQFNNNSSTLGQGGGSWVVSEGSGGRVANQEFNKRVKGYLSLNHVSSSMKNLSTFSEVLTHELGHVLGLAHSSENSSESNNYLKNATMYYMVQSDGRGASIRSYDIDKISLGYPADNMPPYGMDRIMYVVSAYNPITGIGIDRLTVSGGDLETPFSDLSLSVDLANATSNNGSFSLSGTSIIYTLSGAYSDYSLTESQIDGGGAYLDRIEYRISDGVNLSATYSLRIVGWRFDSTPSDGLPDAWMTANFGSTSVGPVGSDRHPDSDPDGDGISNRLEYIYGTDPNDKTSGNPNFTYDHAGQVISWDSVKRMPYYLESSSDLSHWTQIHASLGTGSFLSWNVDNSLKTRIFYRLRMQP